MCASVCTHKKKELRDIEGIFKKVKCVCARARECVWEEKKRTNLIFHRRREHSAKRGDKSKQGKISQFKSVKALAIAW
jgi:ATP phosphoribosyltransferase